MENYTKSPTPVVGEEPNQTPIHSVQLDSNVIHMNVKSGSKVANLINYACNKFEKDDQKQITWNGSGDALNKVVACAEIMKKRFKNLYQINKIGFLNIKVTKEIPSMCIILSKTPLDPNEAGYQTNTTIDELFNSSTVKNKKSDTSNNRTNSSRNEDEEIYVKKKKFNKVQDNKNNNNNNNK